MTLLAIVAVVAATCPYLRSPKVGTFFDLPRWIPDEVKSEDTPGSVDNFVDECTNAYKTVEWKAGQALVFPHGVLSGEEGLEPADPDPSLMAQPTYDPSRGGWSVDAAVRSLAQALDEPQPPSGAVRFRLVGPDCTVTAEDADVIAVTVSARVWREIGRAGRWMVAEYEFPWTLYAKRKEATAHPTGRKIPRPTRITPEFMSAAYAVLDGWYERAWYASRGAANRWTDTDTYGMTDPETKVRLSSFPPGDSPYWYYNPAYWYGFPFSEPDTNRTVTTRRITMWDDVNAVARALWGAADIDDAFTVWKPRWGNYAYEDGEEYDYQSRVPFMWSSTAFDSMPGMSPCGSDIPTFSWSEFPVISSSMRDSWWRSCPAFGNLTREAGGDGRLPLSWSGNARGFTMLEDETPEFGHEHQIDSDLAVYGYMFNAVRFPWDLQSSGVPETGERAPGAARPTMSAVLMNEFGGTADSWNTDWTKAVVSNYTRRVSPGLLAGAGQCLSVVDRTYAPLWLRLCGGDHPMDAEVPYSLTVTNVVTDLSIGFTNTVPVAVSWEVDQTGPAPRVVGRVPGGVEPVYLSEFGHASQFIFTNRAERTEDTGHPCEYTWHLDVEDRLSVGAPEQFNGPSMYSWPRFPRISLVDLLSVVPEGTHFVSVGALDSFITLEGEASGGGFMYVAHVPVSVADGSVVWVKVGARGAFPSTGADDRDYGITANPPSVVSAILSVGVESSRTLTCVYPSDVRPTTGEHRFSRGSMICRDPTYPTHFTRVGNATAAGFFSRYLSTGTNDIPVRTWTGAPVPGVTKYEYRVDSCGYGNRSGLTSWFVGLADGFRDWAKHGVSCGGPFATNGDLLWYVEQRESDVVVSVDNVYVKLGYVDDYKYFTVFDGIGAANCLYGDEDLLGVRCFDGTVRVSTDDFGDKTVEYVDGYSYLAVDHGNPDHVISTWGWQRGLDGDVELRISPYIAMYRNPSTGVREGHEFPTTVDHSNGKFPGATAKVRARCMSRVDWDWNCLRREREKHD